MTSDPQSSSSGGPAPALSSSTDPSPHAAPPEEAEKIGRPGLPVRALAFGAGGFGTAMQLGVVHSLLVAQSQAPDAVAGLSAGAVNAVVLAEVMQAGEAPSSHDGEPLTIDARRQAHVKRRAVRVARFREILDGFQRAPNELANTFVPDAFQVGAQRPLAPLELPIHFQQEREGRERALQARAGFINLYNQLLATRISVGTIARGIRRFLGARAAAEVRSPGRRMVVIAAEYLRVWLLAGANLLRLAPLTWTFVRPLVRGGTPQARGNTAADVIFRSELLAGISRLVSYVAGVLVLAVFWVDVSLVIVAIVPALIELGLYAFDVGRSEWLRYSTWLLGGEIAFTGVAGIVSAIVMPPARRLIFSWLRDYTVFLLVLLGWFVALGIVPYAIVHFSHWRTEFTSLDQKPVPLLQVVGVIVAITLALYALFALAVKVRGSYKNYLRNLLAKYDLADSILPDHPLRELFVAMFDRGYYGKLDLDDVVDRALADNREPSDNRHAKKGRKQIGAYISEECDPKIHVGIAAANVGAGQLETLATDVSVVDGLLAATAVSPIMPPQRIKGKLYVDGVNVANESVRVLVQYLRARVHPQARVVHLYAVASLPFSKQSLPDQSSDGSQAAPSPRRYLTLTDVVRRALDLQRFRDATLERRLVELFARTIPPANGAVTTVGDKRYLRAWITPIEPDEPLEIHARLARASGVAQCRDIIAQTVADGCRASLEAILGDSLKPFVNGTEQPIALCRRAVERHVIERGTAALRRRLIDVERNVDLLGREGADLPPGLPEICSHCALHREATDGTPAVPQTLRIDSLKATLPSWPLEWEDEQPLAGDPHLIRPRTDYETHTAEALRALATVGPDESFTEIEPWPRAKKQKGDGARRPVVSLLFSGGVFRGVFQMGALNALSQANVKPDIIAGASIGSITAALVAHAFAANDQKERDVRIAKLAATYLALDRLILTDRFADFIRLLTIRAADTRMSMRDADRFFRRYEAAGASRFQNEARTVMAGLERLFYVTPFELKALVKSLRERDNANTATLITRYADKWLDRMGVGNQVLGAEPLALIITEHVLKSLNADETVRTSTPFDVFLDRSGIYFLATATNLTRGRLEILGEQQLGDDRRNARLLDGLLASSAFPGVFRPRWSWELMPNTSDQDQYIDGGVMDNLPLDAVAQFLQQSAQAGLVEPRPVVDKTSVPHLLFAASLETETPCLQEEDVRALQANWPALRKRTKMLGYNKKLEHYSGTQQALRAIHSQLHRDKEIGSNGKPGFVPLDLEVVTVKPNWLCGTFAFHPMIGFRRKNQAASIAHGCAATLMQLATLKLSPTQSAWADAWGIDGAKTPTAETAKREMPLLPLAGTRPNGECWFRDGATCPFSQQALVDAKTIPAHTRREINEIYVACGRRDTHYRAPEP